ncbi:glycosyltransferase [Desulfosarcina sp. OttesenSCG-928-A07]|nr:glycosyltransferase [Desulfosarcina sp. OttesenSCG-928-G17]MDL2330243.1 glycosyltransferase [Desulfosarcina sp. OttesenSCG-928-A07]
MEFMTQKERPILAAARNFISDKKYKKAFSCYSLFRFVNTDISEVVKANQNLLMKKIDETDESIKLVMEIPVFGNKDYTIKCFWKIIENSPMDVKIDIIQGPAEGSYLLAWFTVTDFGEKEKITVSDKSSHIKYLLETTRFFDAQFYENQYRPTLDGEDALAHFIRHGFADGNLPARWFDLHMGRDQKISKILEGTNQRSPLPTVQPKVSILVPVFNNAEYLHECIGSIINQTLKDIEIIIINDGSTDQKALDILSSYAHKDNRIRLIHKKNTGYGHSMNCGLLAAKGKYIGIVESDDYIIENMYNDLYLYAEKDNVDFIKADFFRFDHDKSGNLQCYLNTLSDDLSYYNRVLIPIEEKKVFSFPMNTWTGIYKRSFLRENCIFHNETPGASFQDNGFWFQTLCFARRVVFVNTPYYMNRRDNKDSSIYNKDKIFSMHHEFEFIYNKISNHAEIKKKALSAYQFSKYKAYCSSINRSNNESKQDFIAVFSQEFLLSQKKGELDLTIFSEGAKKNLSRIMTDPEKYYLDHCKNPVKMTYYLGVPVDLEQTKNECKVSVIIPVYNEAQTIKECLDRTLSQDLKDIEVICVDDGSTDDSFKILTKYQQIDDRVIVYRQKNKGAGPARNHAISSARGEFVAFLDADDFYPSDDILSTLYRKAIENNVHICGGSFSRLNNGQIQTTYTGTYSLYTFKKECLIEYKDYQFDYGYQRFLYNRKFLRDNNIVFPDYLRFQDPPFFVKAMIAAKKFYSIPLVTYCYRKRSNKIKWTDEKINDVVRGCADILKISRDNSLYLLHRIAVEHLAVDFYDIIFESINRENIKLIELLISANDVIASELLVRSGYQLDATKPKPYLIKPLKHVCRLAANYEHL